MTDVLNISIRSETRKRFEAYLKETEQSGHGVVSRTVDSFINAQLDIWDEKLPQIKKLNAEILRLQRKRDAILSNHVQERLISNVNAILGILRKSPLKTEAELLAWAELNINDIRVNFKTVKRFVEICRENGLVKEQKSRGR